MYHICKHLLFSDLRLRVCRSDANQIVYSHTSYKPFFGAQFQDCFLVFFFGLFGYLFLGFLGGVSGLFLVICL